MDMSINGRSPTSLEIDGMVIDLNRISLREFARLSKQIEAAGDDVLKRCELSGELAARIIVSWPFDKPVTKDSYLDLGLYDTRRVDAAITEANLMFGEKKLEPPSTLPENTSSH